MPNTHSRNNEKKRKAAPLRAEVASATGIIQKLAAGSVPRRNNTIAETSSSITAGSTLPTVLGEDTRTVEENKEMIDAYMLANPHKFINMPQYAAVLHLNFRRAPLVRHSLLTNRNTTNFFIIAMQQAPINSYTNTPLEQTGWHLIETPLKDMLEASWPQAFLYVNKKNWLSYSNPSQSVTRYCVMHFETTRNRTPPTQCIQQIRNPWQVWRHGKNTKKANNSYLMHTHNSCHWVKITFVNMESRLIPQAWRCGRYTIQMYDTVRTIPLLSQRGHHLWSKIWHAIWEKN